MYLLYTSIEISAPPEVVRKKFLDFSQLPIYSPNGFFKSIGPTDPNQALEPGVKMTNVLHIMTINPVLKENSTSCFSWTGSGLLGTFNGEHIFRFEPSTKTQGGTTFVQEEKFTGLLSFLMSDGFIARSVGLKESSKKGFEGYNEDLKKWCEGS